jgi:selenocysteine lyase/cysteine desulfurase
MATAFDIEQVRAQFPSLRSGYIYGDNAGGSQVAQPVIDRLIDYLSNSNAQLGANYDVSKLSTDRVLQGVLDGVRLFNAESEDEVSTVSSSTLGMEHVARALELGGTLNPDDEIIVTGEHEGMWTMII